MEEYILTYGQTSITSVQDGDVCHRCWLSLSYLVLEMPVWLSRFPFSSVQFNSVAQSCPTLCNPMNCSTPGLPVHHQLPEFTQTHIHRVGDAIQPSHPLVSPSSPAPNPSQHQSLFQWVNSLHEVAKVLEFQLQSHSLQRNPRADLLQKGTVSTSNNLQLDVLPLMIAFHYGFFFSFKETW